MAISRRSFCRSALGTTATLGLAGWPVQAAQNAKVRFYKNLAPGHIGVGGNQRQLLTYATQYGFDSITPNVGEFLDKSPTEIEQWLGLMQDKGVRYGAAGLPVEFRRDEDRFADDMVKLPQQAKVLQRLGVTRVATWILPGHDKLTYLQNFEQHRRRLRAAAEVLQDHDIRFGLEWVGPRTSRARSRFPFICTQQGMQELVDAIDLPNMGFLVDTWHWYTSHSTVDELLQLTGKDVILVHLNDAPVGIDVDQQRDNRRALPVTTGIIDMKGFINAMVKIGYDGPMECEPFDQELRAMDDGPALQKTIDALNRVWGLIET